MRRQGAAAGWGYQKNRIRKTKIRKKRKKSGGCQKVTAAYIRKVKMGSLSDSVIMKRMR